MKKFRQSKLTAILATLTIIAASMLPVFGHAVFAQATTGAIRGTVVDQTGAVIAEAKVMATNQATNVSTSTTGGVFSVPNLIPGKYTLTFEAQGFKRKAFTNVEVRLGLDTVIEAALETGGVSEIVTVTAQVDPLVPMIERESSQVSANFSARKVVDLPANKAGGGIDPLALLAPGVTPGFGNINSNGELLSVNGNRPRSNNFTIDGQDNNTVDIGGPVYFVNNQDVVADFQVITSNPSAEYGRNQGAIVNIVTKSGSNDFHGSAFLFHRDRKALDSRTNIEKRSGQEDPEPLLQNIFGGTAGGPVIRNRAFFFASYQGIRIPSTFLSRSSNVAILPEENARLKQEFPGNAAIAALADFGAFALNDLGTVRPRTDIDNPFTTVRLPRDPNVPNGPMVSFAAAFVEREISVPFEEDSFTGRGDINISPRDNVWVRYLFQDGVTINGLATSNGFTGDIRYRVQNISASWNRQLSNLAVSETRFSYTKNPISFGGGCAGLKGCIPAPNDLGTALTFISLSGVRAINGSTLQSIGPATNLPQGRDDRTFQLSEHVFLTLGRHKLVTGVDIRRLHNENLFLPNINGSFTVGSPARLVANSPSVASLTVGESGYTFLETDQFYFFQDDWKVRNNLTLNLGLRYEYTGQPLNVIADRTRERESDSDSAFWRQSLPLDVRTVPRLPGDKNNLAPRIGFAYTPRFWKGLFGNDATVIRGGYSIAYDLAFYNIFFNVQSSSPAVFSDSVVNPAVGSQAIFPIPSSTPTGDKVRAFAETNGLTRRNTFDPRFFSQTIVSPDFHSPYSQQWSLGVQREIKGDNIVEVRYVGNHSVGLFQSVNANPHFANLYNGFTLGGFTFPAFRNLLPSNLVPRVCTNKLATPDNEAACNGRVLGQGLIRVRDNSAQSTYHGLQTSYNGYIFRQLTLGASYTWSKAIDNVSEIFSFNENAFAQNPFDITGAERGLSGFDRRHAFSVAGIWEVPVFKDQRGWLGHLLGGWQVNGVYYLASGTRFTPTQFFFNRLIGGGYFDNNFMSAFASEVARPFVGNPNAPRSSVGISQIDASFIFGTSVRNAQGFWLLNELQSSGDLVAVGKNDVRYIINMPGAATIFGTPFGDVARNSEVGPRINQLNAGFFKTTNITEQIKVQFRAEFFNFLNHPSPGFGGQKGSSIPDRFVEDAGIEGFNFNDFGDMEFNRRTVQFALRLIF
jgi:hypothetical protein